MATAGIYGNDARFVPQMLTKAVSGPAVLKARMRRGMEGRTFCLWMNIYLHIYIYNYFILDLNSDWFTLSHTGSYWVPSSMSLTHDVSLYFLWISLCSSLIWEHDPT